ncbi:DUF6252 family protein [Hymenobacter sp. HDW8]|uniref:DUF6252 family protein n=1 Tax=Hymenobacter sp. HDW8 TaxID=2714932 RepID=UPI00140CFC2C|nr:DUF6252 family protein [Hymenobacter sp. HDW8]QIL78438.1 hypothetical protein G7064_21700 [Hymenobacter sp. HDW8]
MPLSAHRLRLPSPRRRLLPLLPLLSWLLLALPLSQCRQQEAEPLPPETRTGAQTFGCKIDGRVFVPRNGRGKPGLVVEYVNLGEGKGGGYYLNLPATDWRSTPLEGVNITTDSLLVEEGQTYQFQNSKGSAHASYYGGVEYQKRDQDVGELIITRLDPQQGILSGRFHFVATHPTTGRQVHVTDGRFDVRF